MPLDFHPTFLLMILILALILFGPGKLPELGGAVGRSLREFRRASSGATDDEARGEPAASDLHQPPAGEDRPA
jgi:sec-independent protein translocase protein TatA